MTTITDHVDFLQWFNEIEIFSSRKERAFEDLRGAPQQKIIEWLNTAFNAGQAMKAIDEANHAYDATPKAENGELVKRLRNPSGIGEPLDHATMREAADRIEELEARITKCLRCGCYFDIRASDDRSCPHCQWRAAVTDDHRAALSSAIEFLEATNVRAIGERPMGQTMMARYYSMMLDILHDLEAELSASGKEGGK